MGGSPGEPVQNYSQFGGIPIARYRGLGTVVVFGPGVYTPGFTLTPASQA